MKLSFVPIFGFVILFSLLGKNGIAAENQNIGDRLVISINNVSYSQRQVEKYLLVKESLRKKISPAWQHINADNWYMALKIFAWDMLIEQESSRLGSFQTPSKGIEKYRKVVEKKVKKHKSLSDHFSRLGITDRDLTRSLAAVLRIEAFRMSKKKQEKLAKRDEEGGDRSEEIPAWLRRLEQRSVIRLYENAETYIRIQPTLGSAKGAL